MLAPDDRSLLPPLAGARRWPPRSATRCPRSRRLAAERRRGAAALLAARCAGGRCGRGDRGPHRQRHGVRADLRRRPPRAGHARGARDPCRRRACARRSSSWGSRCGATPRSPRRSSPAGHGVGLHCDRHRNLLRLTPWQAREDILRAQATIEEATGRSPTLYRPPYGVAQRGRARPAPAAAAGARCCGATGVATGRPAPRRSRSPRLLTGGAGEGAVLLLHDADDYCAPGSWRRTVAALPRVLDTLGERGLGRRALTLPDGLGRPDGDSRRGTGPTAAACAAGAGAKCSVVPRARWWVEALVDRLAVLGLRRDQQPRARCACTPRWPTAAGVLHLERSLHLDPELALNRWLAAPPHARPAALRLLRQRPLHRHPRAAWAGCGSGARTSTGRCATRWSRSTCSGWLVFWLYPTPRRGCWAAGASTTSSPPPGRFGSLAHRAAGRGRQPVRGDALPAHGVGGVVLGWCCGALPRRICGAGCWRSSTRA